MTKTFSHHFSQLLTIAGLCLMLAGATMWWRQSRLETALLGQEERILLAVTAEPEPQPARLPEFREAAAPLVRSSSPTPSATESGALALTATPLLTPSPGPFPPAVEVPTRISIPSINLDAAVVEMGWVTNEDENGNAYSEWVVPAYAAGWHKNSALPGHNGNVVLSGHHNVDGEVFRYLADLEMGAMVMLEVGGVTYRYQVQEKYIVKEKDEPLEVRLENNRFVEPTTSEQLTLVSCWPYETNTHRVIIVARPLLNPAEIVTPPAIE